MAWGRNKEFWPKYLPLLHSADKQERYSAKQGKSKLQNFPAFVYYEILSPVCIPFLVDFTFYEDKKVKHFALCATCVQILPFSQNQQQQKQQQQQPMNVRTKVSIQTHRHIHTPQLFAKMCSGAVPSER